MAVPAPRPTAASAPLVVDADAGPVLLGRFGFGVNAAEPLDVTLPLLAGESRGESWRCALPDAFRIEAVAQADAGPIEAAAETSYRELLRRVRGSAQPHLLRIWNFFPAINAGEGDLERYRRFCVGRARAVDAAFSDPPPAATAIGSPAAAEGGLKVFALCSAQPALALENPRQTPAWRYPREYSPVAPGFSRGALVGAGAGAVLLASGTASIIGHVSRHVGDPPAQIEESLANLAALLDEAGRRADAGFDLARCASLRVYLRDPTHLALAQAAIRARVGNAPVRYLQGDICRRELDVELEGVFTAA